MSMRKAALWKSDWFVGLAVALVFLAGTNSDLIQNLEFKAYDLGVKASNRSPSDKIAIIAIDDASIESLGKWPWPREVQGRLLMILAGSRAKVIGHTGAFSEPQVDAGSDYIRNILETISAPTFKNSPQLTQIHTLLRNALNDLDNDQRFSDSIDKANRVLLGMYFEPGAPQETAGQQLPDYLSKNALTNVKDASAGAGKSSLPIQTMSAAPPIEALGSKAYAVGHMNVTRDVDGAIRTEPLVLEYYGQYYPSLSLLLAAKSLNLRARSIQVNLGRGIEMDSLNIATDPALRMRTHFYNDRDGKPAFEVDSFQDVLSGKIPAGKYRDKIVLIGATAAGVEAQQATSIADAMAPVVILAHSVSSILKQDYFIEPGWAKWANIAIPVVVALYLMLLLPWLSTAIGAVLSVVMFFSMLAAHFVLMTQQGVWLHLMMPSGMLVAGYLVFGVRRFLAAHTGKIWSDANSAENNRMMGLAFQGKGQLDVAFDKFRKVPLDDNLMELLYNLGLDFERKRQFNKAESVFRYMADYKPRFRDLEARLAQSKDMSNTVVLGGNAGKGNDSTIKLDRVGVAKPMLGRYEIQRELGKGAMGVVYLGTDSKISRTVAIKTLAFSQEFEDEEMEEVKARFFREAESAGRLSHPNIVTVYDAGEEHDLAYIAMEFLKGKDLVAHTKPGNLLPLPKVLSIVARVADALDYAHGKSVVHRDIKPANIMYDPECDIVKVTDFGIARITDTSRTKTGMVLGTPNYMSPEQLAGKKTEGTSDLFSLGVTLYQLISGKQPFQGESLTQLMYVIANEPHIDILSVKPKAPPSVVAIINKALSKQVNRRFKTGGEMAEAIRQCAASLKGGN